MTPFLKLKTLYLLGEVILQGPSAMNISRGTMQPSTEGGYFPEGDGDNIETKFIKLFHLGGLGGLHADRLWIEHQDVHGKPDTAEGKVDRGQV